MLDSEQPRWNDADKRWMEYALALSQKAWDTAEVPIGAVVVYDDVLVGEGYNQPIKTSDPTAHAEIIALRMAAKTLGNYRLTGCTLYTSLEPCLMCAGSLVHARISRLVYAASDPKMGAVNSHFQVLNSPVLNHRVHVDCGLFQEQASQMLKSFFQQRR